MNESPWNAYGRLPPKPKTASKADKQDPVSGVVEQIERDRQQLESYLDGVIREFFEIRSGNTGYQQIIADALTPSTRPETVEEHLARLAREAQTRRSRPSSAR